MATKERKSTSQAQLNVEESVDRLLVKTLEETVEQEVLKRLEKPLHIVVHEAVLQAIAEASRITEQSVTEVQGEDEPHRPKAGGRCAAVWETLDAMRDKGEIPTLKEILAIGRRKKWNENNTRIEYYQWRKFHGIHGRLKANRFERRRSDRRVSGRKLPKRTADRREAHQDRRAA